MSVEKTLAEREDALAQSILGIIGEGKPYRGDLREIVIRVAITIIGLQERIEELQKRVRELEAR